MADWTINAASLSSLGIEAIALSFYSADTDILRIKLLGDDMTGTAQWGHGDAIELKKDSTTWFQGSISAGRAFGSQLEEGWDFEVEGPWAWLEQNQYLQQSEFVVSALPVTSEYTSAVTLGLDASDNRTTVMATIDDILAHAISRGADFTRSVASGTIKYVTEARDITCADAIRQLLRWEPDIVVGMDYSSDPPVLRFVRRGSAGAVSYATDGGDKIKDIRVSSRPDIQIAGCAIHWHKVDTVDDVAYKSIETDKYPGAVSDTAGNVVHFTMDLDGSESTRQSAEVQVDTLPTTGTIGSAKTWVMKHVEWLQDVDTGDFDLSDLSGEVKDIQKGSDTDYTNYPRELTGGAIFPWMTGIKAANVALTFIVTYTGDEADQERKLFDKDLERKVTVTVRATDATGKTYKGLAGYSPGESVPTGWAQAYYDSLATLQYEATLSLEEDECDGAVRPFKVLNLSGGASGWSTMKGIVYGVHEEPLNGLTRIEAGPQAHVLGPEDWRQLARANRSGYSWRFGRTGGELQGESVDGPVATPFANVVTHPIEDAALHPFEIYADGTVIKVHTGRVNDELATIAASFASNATGQEFVIKVTMTATTLDTANPYSLDGADFDSAEVLAYSIGSVPSDTLPEIDETTGSDTDGVWYIPIGTEDDFVVNNDNIRNSIQVHFCPPDNLRHWPAG